MLCVILKFSPASVVLEQLQESRSAGGTTRPLGICLTICSNLSAPCAGSRSFQPQAGAGVCWRSGSSGGSLQSWGGHRALCSLCQSCLGCGCVPLCHPCPPVPCWQLRFHLWPFLREFGEPVSLLSPIPGQCWGQARAPGAQHFGLFGMSCV